MVTHLSVANSLHMHFQSGICGFLYRVSFNAKRDIIYKQ